MMDLGIAIVQRRAEDLVFPEGGKKIPHLLGVVIRKHQADWLCPGGEGGIRSQTKTVSPWRNGFFVQCQRVT